MISVRRSCEAAFIDPRGVIQALPLRCRTTVLERREEAHAKRRGTRKREGSGTDERATNAGLNESEIDQVLADSFPASNAPPWTLGVMAPLPQERTPTPNVRKRAGLHE